MTAYIILAGGEEEEMPSGYSEHLWIYLGKINVDDEVPIEEIPELLYKTKQHDDYHLEAEEIKNTAINADYIRVIEVNEDRQFDANGVHLKEFYDE